MRPLLTRRPSRGGAALSQAGADDIKKHKWIAAEGSYWEDMYSKKIPPPIKPEVSGEFDTNNFEYAPRPCAPPAAWAGSARRVGARRCPPDAPRVVVPHRKYPDSQGDPTPIDARDQQLFERF